MKQKTDNRLLARLVQPFFWEREISLVQIKIFLHFSLESHENLYLAVFKAEDYVIGYFTTLWHILFFNKSFFGG